MEYLSATHASFYYIVLRINPGLTICKDVTTMVDNSLDNNYQLPVTLSTFFQIDVAIYSFV